jgi:hypothetical protein
MPHIREILRGKNKIYAVRQMYGNNRTINAKLGRQIKSPIGENFTRQQLFYRGINKKNETRH